MKKTTQDFLRKQSKLRTKPGKRIARQEEKAQPRAEAPSAAKGKGAASGKEQERKQ